MAVEASTGERPGASPPLPTESAKEKALTCDLGWLTIPTQCTRRIWPQGRARASLSPALSQGCFFFFGLLLLRGRLPLAATGTQASPAPAEPAELESPQPQLERWRPPAGTQTAPLLPGRARGGSSPASPRAAARLCLLHSSRRAQVPTPCSLPPSTPAGGAGRRPS